MKYRDVSKREYESARHWESEAEQIRRRVSLVIGWLGTLFNGREVGGVGGLEFNRSDDALVVATLRTPTGDGRLRLTFDIATGELAAKIIVERDSHDELGRLVHTPVWAFYIPRRGNGFVDPVGDSSRYVFDSGAGDALENSIFDLGLSISFALVAGPVLSN